MARGKRPPRPRSGALCCCQDGKPAMGDGLLCSDHELLWIAKTGKTSHGLKHKDVKRWKQFMRDYRVKGVLFYGRMFNSEGIYNQAASRIWATRKRGKVYVLPTTLRSAGEALSAGASEDHSGSGEGDNQASAC